MFFYKYIYVFQTQALSYSCPCAGHTQCSPSCGFHLLWVARAAGSWGCRQGRPRGQGCLCPGERGPALGGRTSPLLHQLWPQSLISRPDKASLLWHKLHLPAKLWLSADIAEHFQMSLSEEGTSLSYTISDGVVLPLCLPACLGRCIFLQDTVRTWSTLHMAVFTSPLRAATSLLATWCKSQHVCRTQTISRFLNRAKHLLCCSYSVKHTNNPACWQITLPLPNRHCFIYKQIREGQ